jgi:hypothetical protein
VHEALWRKIHWKCFNLAKEALQYAIWYNFDSKVGDEVLDGTYMFDADFDDHTKDMLQEVAHT